MQRREKGHNATYYTPQETTQKCSLPYTLNALKEPVFQQMNQSQDDQVTGQNLFVSTGIVIIEQI